MIRPIYLRKPSRILAYILITIIVLEVLGINQKILYQHFSAEGIASSLREFNRYDLRNTSYLTPSTNPVIELLKEKNRIGLIYSIDTAKDIRDFFESSSVLCI